MMFRVRLGRLGMVSAAAKILTHFALVILICCSLSAQCPVESLVVSGRVDHPPHDASVRVQLVYCKEKQGESAEAKLDGETFKLPLEFLTRGTKPVFLSSVRTKCDRKPQTLVIRLINGDREYDHVSLDFAKDFQRDESGVYIPRSQVVLNPPQP